MDLVRSYNATRHSLDSRERRLLSDEMRKLDRILGVGLNKLCWAQSKGVDKFVSDASKALRQLQQLVALVQRGRRVCAGRISRVAAVELLGVDRGVVYEVYWASVID